MNFDFSNIFKSILPSLVSLIPIVIIILIVVLIFMSFKAKVRIKLRTFKGKSFRPIHYYLIYVLYQSYL